MTATENAFQYDPFSWSSHPDPYGNYEVLRSRFPVYFNPEYEIWVLSKFGDVQTGLRNWRGLSSASGVELDGTFGPGSFIDLDPPRHDELRKILHREFTPKAVTALTETVEACADELIETWAPGDAVDLARDFALKFPVAVTRRLLGLPAADQPMLERIAATVIVREPGEPTIPPIAVSAGDELRHYLEGQLSDRRVRPADDWLGLIVAAEADGHLRPDEVLSFAYLLFVAGTETTSGFMAMALAVLAAHPEQRNALREDWNLLHPAVEELLRYESPVQNLSRVTSEDMEIRGTPVPAGSRVLLLYGSANRDEERYEAADRFDISRDFQRNLAFGEGIHHCLGAPLARLEAYVALRKILTQFPDYEITGDLVPIHTHTTRAVESLPAML